MKPSTAESGSLQVHKTVLHVLTFIGEMVIVGQAVNKKYYLHALAAGHQGRKPIKLKGSWRCPCSRKFRPHAQSCIDFLEDQRQQAWVDCLGLIVRLFAHV